MSSISRFFYLQFFASIPLLNLSHGLPLIGDYRDAKDNEFLFAVSIGKRSDLIPLPLEKLHFCTGTLISPKHVLTANHCVNDEKLNEFQVVIGSNDLRKGEIYYPSSWMSYEKWKYGKEMKYLIHDIAIITLGKEVHAKIKPAKLVLSVPYSWPGADVKVAGWGDLEGGKRSPILKTATFKLIPREECEERIRNVTYDSFTLLQQDMCSQANPLAFLESGDSGGPLLDKKNYLVGVNMAVVPVSTKYNDTGDALLKKRVNSHVSIYYYRDFITSVTKGYLKLKSV